MAGVGIDIEHISRFDGLTYEKDQPFFDRLFTKSERAYCFSQARPAEHFAVRFAAKEAVVKALADAEAGAPPAYENMEILRDAGQPPRIVFLGGVSVRFDVRVSLSHTEDTAVACALVL